MGVINPNFANLAGQYLFREVAKRRAAYESGHPSERIISLGIGDVTLPLPRVVTRAMSEAAEELDTPDGFRGYPPAFGYDFLREAIARDYASRGVTLSPEEIYVSDGAKTDAAWLPLLFGKVTVVLTDPVYPVYHDALVLAGHRILLLPATAENHYLPTPEGLPMSPHVLYLCSPGNPTGAAYDRAGLAAWVAYAMESGSLIVYDAAYEAFLPPQTPHSILEIPGAESCAIELCSFSKSAGFTGVRCAWSVFPKEVRFGGRSLVPLWERVKSTTSNGVSYVTQRGAEAALTQEGKAESGKRVKYYLENAARLLDCLGKKGWHGCGGDVSPYLWVECPRGLSSWETFDLLLERAKILSTPGAGFGVAGEGYIRFSAFASREEILLATGRLAAI